MSRVSPLSGCVSLLSVLLFSWVVSLSSPQSLVWSLQQAETELLGRVTVQHGFPILWLRHRRLFRPSWGVTGNLGIGLGHEFPAALRSVTQNLFGPPAPRCLRGYGVSVLGVLYNAVDSLAQSPLHALVRAVGGLGAGELLVGNEMILFKAVSMPT